jgi:hypothetical protein
MTTSPIEPSRAALGVSSAADHGAAVLGLAVVGASPLLLSPFWSPSHVRLPLADPCAPRRALSWSATAAGPLARRHERWCGRSLPPPCWAELDLGPAGRVRPARAFLPLLLRPKAAMGQAVLVGRPSSNKKILFYFLLLFEKRNSLENDCVLIFALKL